MSQPATCLALCLPLLVMPSCQCASPRGVDNGSRAAPDARRATPPELRPDRDAALLTHLHAAMALVQPLHQRPTPPRPGDWLTGHVEPGQTFREYCDERPILPDLSPGQGRRRHLYIQPLGPLTKTERRIVELAGDYLDRVFGLEVRFSQDLPLTLVPPVARRLHPSSGDEQILTSYVLESLLVPRLPADAAALILFTASDLWPGDGWNFVFGQASLRDRVGVWSISRNGDPDESRESFSLALVRTLKVAVHETGHMFSMRHCTAYACVMAGSNSIDESDRRPLWLCPECMAKIAWATRYDPREQHERAGSFARAHALTDEADFYERSLAVLGELRAVGAAGPSTVAP